MLDICFANDVCGKHGRCINTLSGYNCSCSFLYDGLLCEKSKIYFLERKTKSTKNVKFPVLKYAIGVVHKKSIE